MSRPQLPLPHACLAAALLLLLLPVPAAGKALEREGTVAILPTLRLPALPAGLPPAPGLTLSFGFKPMRRLEVGIDAAISRNDGEASGGDFSFIAAPLGVSFEFTPLPDWNVRPIFGATLGKALLAVDGPGDHYAEYTPYAVTATAGLTADLSDDVGLYADGGYQYARDKDPLVGTLDGGGPIVRLGVYFRWAPEPKRGR